MISRIFTLLILSFTFLFSFNYSSNDYRLFLSKQKVEDLNTKAKFTVKNSLNDTSWVNNQLNMRNTNFLDILEEYALTKREKEILDYLESNITRKLVLDNKNIDCENIIDPEVNKIIPKIERSECVLLEFKIDNYFESSFYNFSISKYGFLNSLDDTEVKNIKRITFNDILDIDIVYKNLKRISATNKDMLNNIEYLNLSDLEKYTRKIVNQERPMISKKEICENIKRKALDIGFNGNDIYTLCDSYTFKSIDSSIQLSPDRRKKKKDILIDLLSSLNSTRVELEGKRDDAQDLMNGLVSRFPQCHVDDPTIPGTENICPGVQVGYDNAKIDRDYYQAQIDEIYATIAIYQNLLATTDENEEVSGIMYYMKLRAYEDVLAVFWDNLNRVHFYINDYILKNSNPPRNSLNIIDLYGGVIASNWPKSIVQLDSVNNEIEYFVDWREVTSNYVVRYTNLRLPLGIDFAFVKELLVEHALVPQNAIIDTSTQEITIPLYNKTNKFIDKMISLRSELDYIVGNVDKFFSNIDRNLVSCTAGESNQTTIKSLGNEVRKIYFCNSDKKWELVPNFHQESISYNFSNLRMKGKKFYEKKSANKAKVSINIDANGTLMRIK